MNVFVAGGSGTIGQPLVRALVAAGHQVTALTRRMGKRDELAALGATVAVADALDHDALVAAVRAARPTHIVHQLTALPAGGPRRARDLEATNRLRIEGTRNLIDAATGAGVRRLVVGSFAPLSPRGAESPFPGDTAGSAAVGSMEGQVLEATRRGDIDGVILRYGLFYGLETPSTRAMIEMIRKHRLPVVRGDAGLLPVIQIDDAVAATVRALMVARAGATYDIVDDRAVSLTEIVETIARYTGSAPPRRVPGWLVRLAAPYMARITSIRLPLSNEQAKADLGWRPAFPTLREGLAGLARAA
jgi:nucleoside-diphosphate-sugar epimerase